MLKEDVLGAGEPASRPLACGDRTGAGGGLAAPAASSGEIDPGTNLSRSTATKQATPERHDRVAETVLRSFNTWAFKREQPTDPQLMLQIISGSMAQSAAVPFILYWGKGPRRSLDQPDLKCLEYLDALTARVRMAYASGAALRLIFTDTHAALNGHSPRSACEYFGAIDAAARERGVHTCWLSDLLRNAQSAVPPELADEPMPEEMRPLLSAGAAKWYYGQGTPEEGAAKYFRMNMLEKHAVELAFPRSIFITFSGSKFRSLFPARLPIFFMYSLRRGVSVKPWFLPAVAAPSIAQTA